MKPNLLFLFGACCFIAKAFSSPVPAKKSYAVSADEFQCPESEGLFPNPYDCSTFYQCSSYYPWLFSCPSGLYFNPATSQCDYTSSVSCQITSDPPIQSSSATSATNNNTDESTISENPSTMAVTDTTFQLETTEAIQSDTTFDRTDHTTEDLTFTSNI